MIAVYQLLNTLGSVACSELTNITEYMEHGTQVTKYQPRYLSTLVNKQTTRRGYAYWISPRSSCGSTWMQF